MSGFEGVLVGETRLSEVDGERGQLLVAGLPLEMLAEAGAAGGFEMACGLLWDGRLPDAQRRRELQRALGEARVRAFVLLPSEALAMPDAMDGLRAAMAQLTLPLELAWPEDAITLTGACATYAAAWLRRAAGLAPVAPDPQRDHASDYLRMVRGREPSASQSAAMATYLCAVSEHGMNASTFAARVVASTGADGASAVVAGLCALKGPLHGGAPGPVLDMLDAIGAPERAEAWLRGELDVGRRIMGMGHRVYRRRDPRAAVLESALGALGEPASVERLELARAVERTAEALLRERHRQRALRADVEFYTAVLLEALGIPRAGFTATFAVARVAGWCAHVYEQRRTGRLIRPEVRYVGERPAA